MTLEVQTIFCFLDSTVRGHDCVWDIVRENALIKHQVQQNFWPKPGSRLRPRFRDPLKQIFSPSYLWVPGCELGRACSLRPSDSQKLKPSHWTTAPSSDGRPCQLQGFPASLPAPSTCFTVFLLSTSLSGFPVISVSVWGSFKKPDLTSSPLPLLPVTSPQLPSPLAIF